MDLWLKLFTWFVLSGLMFPHSVYQATWELQRPANDVQGVSRYAWVKAVWQYLVQCLDDVQRRLCNSISQLQFKGFSVLQASVLNYNIQIVW